MTLRTAALTVLVACVLLTAAAPLSAQVFGGDDEAGELVITPHGPQFGFRDENDPDNFVVVFLEGIEARQGDRRMSAETLVVVLGTAGGGDEDGDPEDGDDEGDDFAGQRIHEIYLEGDVFYEMGTERVAGAEAIYMNNDTGAMVVVEGELVFPVPDTDGTVYVRFEQMRKLSEDRRVLDGVTYTSCSCGERDWHIRTERAVVEETSSGRILATEDNTLVYGTTPLLWWPGMRINLDADSIPLKSVDFGDSSRYGTELVTIWGGDAGSAATSFAELFGYSGSPVEAEWELEIAMYSERGVFIAPEIRYQTEDSYGKLFGAFINDSAERDRLDQPITDNTRGRIDLEHRTNLDENRVVDVEFSDLSDRNFLEEFYESEFRQGKEQETYVNYRDVEDNTAFQVLFKSRTNDFQTQVEYLPRVEHRMVGENLGEFLGGDAILTTQVFADNARRRFDDELVPDTSDLRNVRVGGRATVDVPIDVGPDRLLLTATADATHFNHGNGSTNNLMRTSAAAGVAYSQTWSGVDPAAHSDTWNIDGLRHVFEPMVSYFSRFHLSHGPSELRPIDNVETLSRFQRLAVSLRNRLQTHQDGQVKTILDTEVIIPLFFSPDRDNAMTLSGDSEVEGDVIVDAVWTPGANIRWLRNSRTHWRAELDPNDKTYVESFLSFSTQITPRRTILLANNKSKHIFNFTTIAHQWVIDPKWSYAIFWQRDNMLSETAWIGFVLRRREKCWITDVEISKRRGNSTSGRNRDDLRFEFSVSPTIFEDREPLIEKVSRRIR